MMMKKLQKISMPTYYSKHSKSVYEAGDRYQAAQLRA